jgi:molybdate transport system ATP-binding protein
VSIEARFIVTRGNFELDVDLTLPAQGVSSLYGPSGCGKTTLLRAIAGLDRHAGGFLKVGGTTWQASGRFVPPHQRRLAYVFQEASLFAHLNVRRNLEYGLRRVPRTDRRVALEQAIDLLEIGHLLERQSATLSGGERQRVAIARALAVSPSLLLMDEPLAALDVDRRQEVLPYIEALHRELDIPVIHVSHSPEEVARLADHMVLLETGRVAASGDVHEMFTRLDLPLAFEQDAAAIIESTVAGHDENYHLTQLDFAGGQITVTREDIRPGEQVRLRLAARDVSLTLEHQSDTSILNIFPAVVNEITREDSAMVTVRLLAGGVPVLARITRKSAVELKLEIGKSVFAQVKSVALLN